MSLSRWWQNISIFTYNWQRSFSLGLLWLLNCCKWIILISFKCSFCAEEMRVHQRLMLTQGHFIMRLISEINVNTNQYLVMLKNKFSCIGGYRDKWGRYSRHVLKQLPPKNLKTQLPKNNNKTHTKTEKIRTPTNWKNQNTKNKCKWTTIIAGRKRCSTELEHIDIITWGNDTTVIKNFIDTAVIHCLEKDKNKIGIYKVTNHFQKIKPNEKKINLNLEKKY